MLCPFPWGAVFPSKAMSPGSRSTSVPSGILIHPTVWPQYTNVTALQTGQTGQRFRGIGRRRTVTCNGRPKTTMCKVHEILCTLHVAVARSSSDNSAIRYVLPVLWITPCNYFRIMGHWQIIHRDSPGGASWGKFCPCRLPREFRFRFSE